LYELSVTHETGRKAGQLLPDSHNDDYETALNAIDLKIHGMALDYLEKALAAYGKSPKPTDWDLACVHNTAGVVLSRMGRHGEAAIQQQRAYDLLAQSPDSEPAMAIVANNIALAFFEAGEAQAALAWLIHASRLCERSLGRENRSTVGACKNIAVMKYALGARLEALAWCEASLPEKDTDKTALFLDLKNTVFTRI
jgi:tetratricopeptide (TPR) repeat protein